MYVAEFTVHPTHIYALYITNKTFLLNDNILFPFYRWVDGLMTSIPCLFTRMLSKTTTHMDGYGQ